VVAHSRLGLIVLRLGTCRPTDRRVGEVHVRRHRGRVGWPIWLRVGEVIGRSRRGYAAMRGRGPSKTRHVWASVDTVGPMVVVGRRLKRLGRSIRMRGHLWTSVGHAAEA
jgi:hypothetical protein